MPTTAAPIARARIASLLLLLLAGLLVACGGSDDPETADPTTAPVSEGLDKPAPEETVEAAEPTEIPTATPLPTISAPTVPSVASTACDRMPYSVWNAENGDRISIGELTQFEYFVGGESQFGSYTCEGDVLTISLKDGDTIEGAYSADPSELTVGDTAYSFNQAESAFQE